MVVTVATSCADASKHNDGKQLKHRMKMNKSLVNGIKWIGPDLLL